VENIPKTGTDFLPMKKKYVLLFMKRFAGRKLAGNSAEQSPVRQEIVSGDCPGDKDNLLGQSVND